MRILDIIISGTFLVLFAPFFVCIIIILRFTGEGEIFYLQERVGFKGAKFEVIKFATMLKDSPNIGSGTITSKNDFRILPFGRFLRKTKINELPQLVNILVGDMSLIGPRPHAERDLKGVNEVELSRINSLKPGLSGVGSLIFRNEEDILNQFDEPRQFYDTVIAPYKASLELWYVENRGFKINVMLILLTMYIVLFGHSRILYKLFRSLPVLPESLKTYILKSDYK